MSVGAWNFARAELGIVRRLEQCLQHRPGAWARVIGTRPTLESVTEEMQDAPAVYVIYDGFAVLESDEGSARLAHRWFAVVTVKNTAQQRAAAPRNQEAGPYLCDVLQALHGWTPPDCVSPFVPVTPPRPYYSPAKFVYYPLAFTTESYHCARPDI
ncbi:MAG: hypothetical protein LBE78_12925 [Burkholderiaceae bacterium]|jgi:hypothetical protein|nr:hypothetical protein [Burkholderiaceae bacterium]